MTFSLQSRAAAVNELKGESGVDCEAAYETALWMLYALVDVTMQDNEQVDEEDRVTVDKCRCFQLSSIRWRLLTGCFGGDFSCQVDPRSPGRAPAEDAQERTPAVFVLVRNRWILSVFYIYSSVPPSVVGCHHSLLSYYIGIYRTGVCCKFCFRMESTVFCAVPV
jgi:hypothetical protein